MDTTQTTANSIGQMANGDKQNATVQPQVSASPLINDAQLQNSTPIPPLQTVQSVKVPDVNEQQLSAAPVGSSRKEQEPARQTSEVVAPLEATETQPEISQELKEAGVEATKDDTSPVLSIEDQLAGMEVAKESVPMNTHIAAHMQFPNQPFSQDEAVKILHTTSPDDSQHWLAVLVLEILHKLHIRRKKEIIATKTAIFEQAA